MAASANKLNVLDFSPGIRAKDINENFDLISQWIKAERLRIGGWGVVEGFELTKDLPNYSVNVSEGIIISENGEEIHADGTRLFAGEPSYRNITEEIVVKDGGIVELQFVPYSNSLKRTVRYNPPKEIFYNENEVTIIDEETSKQLNLNDIRAVVENIITVNNSYVGRTLRVTYLYANDRIDGIFIKKDGSEYIYEQGIISTSPSQQIIQDYMAAGYYFIGFAYWHIGEIIDVEFITKNRSLRPIYVDKSGNIFLNGVLYTGYNFIFFVEPEHPSENDLWFNTEEEILYIWRPDESNKYSWKPINDLSRFNREYGYFTEKQNPSDLKTFTFEEKANLRFVPGKNQLTIIIDQVVVMRDQYEEIYDESVYDKDACTGYGFKLKEPLERPSVVEVYVDHNINTKGEHLELFPHITSFLNVESLVVDNPANNKIVLESEYEIGNHQLEVWLNGRYLRLNEEYAETTNNFVEASIDNNGQLSNVFKIIVTRKAGDVITYKVTRQMATYDHLRKVTDSLNEKVDNAVDDLSTTKEKFEQVISETGKTINDLKVRVKSNEDNIKSLDETKISQVFVKNLNTEIKDKIIRAKKKFIINTVSDQISVPDLSANDHISLYYIGGQMQRYILIQDEDYIIKSNNDTSGIIIELDTKWLGSEDAKLYIEAILIGVQ